jgi:hypothetical protein
MFQFRTLRYLLSTYGNSLDHPLSDALEGKLESAGIRGIIAK